MSPARSARQLSLDDLGTPLVDTVFVVVDLETTGGSPEHSRITEIGAVKVRAGDVLGEMQTLVDPGEPIPTSITALTGITDGMVAASPPVEAVLPTFLEFCRGATVVAHNARFDVGFLNAALTRLDYPRLDNPVVCTAALARRLVRDEVRNCKLATLAHFFRARTVPVHRALADARATVDVLHGLLERAGSYGVLMLEDLLEFAKVRNTPLYKARRSLADGLPSAPGVYAFRSESGEVLYVGKATDLRARVRSYFGNDDRRKVTALLNESAAVDHWVCPTPIEAAVREVAMIRQHRPRFNRRSKSPEATVWLKLTAERFPRLSIVRGVRDDGARYLGPLGSRRVAEQVADAVHEVVPIRRCTTRIGVATRFGACALKEMGRCRAPCDGTVDVAGYAPTAAIAATVFEGDPAEVVTALTGRMRALAGSGRFEEAAATRDRLRALVAAVDRTRRLTTTAAPAELVAARPAGRSARLDVVLVRHGMLIASASCLPAALEDTVARLRRTHAALHGLASERGAPDAGAEERDLVARWLEGDGTRLLWCDGCLADTIEGGRLLAQQRTRLDGPRRRAGRPEAELQAKRTRRAG